MIGYITGNILSVYGNTVSFQHDVRYIVIIDDVVIVLVADSSTGDVQKQPLNNVYAIDRNGEIIWNIKDIIDRDAFFAIINVDDTKHLIAVDAMGIRYIIDIINKKVLSAKGYK
jgi:hypothetical protein